MHVSRRQRRHPATLMTLLILSAALIAGIFTTQAPVRATASSQTVVLTAFAQPSPGPGQSSPASGPGKPTAQRAAAQRRARNAKIGWGVYAAIRLAAGGIHVYHDHFIDPAQNPPKTTPVQ